MIRVPASTLGSEYLIVDFARELVGKTALGAQADQRPVDF
jgi:hypothetical protein